jgi:hypothetical protein
MNADEPIGEPRCLGPARQVCTWRGKPKAARSVFSGNPLLVQTLDRRPVDWKQGQGTCNLTLPDETGLGLWATRLARLQDHQVSPRLTLAVSS